jgi:hypothetical protein
MMIRTNSRVKKKQSDSERYLRLRVKYDVWDDADKYDNIYIYIYIYIYICRERERAGVSETSAKTLLLTISCSTQASGEG